MSKLNTPPITWYFDFISPFSYFQFYQLQAIKKLRPALQIDYRPVLFAGLLKYHGHKGPAEIPAKRQMTYRYCHWYASNHNIPFSMPSAHPFNPLPMLRLAVARNGDEAVVLRLFNHAWRDSAGEPEFFSVESLAKLPGLENAAEEIASPAVKNQLRLNTDTAIAKGVFGVPTMEIGTQLFWGVDMTPMAMDYLDNPAGFDDLEYRRLDTLPVARARSQ